MSVERGINNWDLGTTSDWLCRVISSENVFFLEEIGPNWRTALSFNFHLFSLIFGLGKLWGKKDKNENVQWHMFVFKWVIRSWGILNCSTHSWMPGRCNQIALSGVCVWLLFDWTINFCFKVWIWLTECKGVVLVVWLFPFEREGNILFEDSVWHLNILPSLFVCQFNNPPEVTSQKHGCGTCQVLACNWSWPFHPCLQCHHHQPCHKHNNIQNKHDHWVLDFTICDNAFPIMSHLRNYFVGSRLSIGCWWYLIVTSCCLSCLIGLWNALGNVGCHGDVAMEWKAMERGNGS